MRDTVITIIAIILALTICAAAHVDSKHRYRIEALEQRIADIYQGFTEHKPREAPLRTDIMRIAIGDMVETTKKWGDSKIVPRLPMSGTVRFIKYQCGGWVVYFDCDQTGEVEGLSEIWLKVRP